MAKRKAKNIEQDATQGIITCCECGDSCSYENVSSDYGIAEQTEYIEDTENNGVWRCPACKEYADNKLDIIQYEQDHQDETY
jgi:hypothetical protein